LNQITLKQAALRETALLLGLLFLGFVLMPIAIYWVGQYVFGNYAGYGYADFFGTLSAKIRGGDRIAWFFALSPYLAWQFLRLTLFAWRRSGESTG
jgi:hypothetical protein